MALGHCYLPPAHLAYLENMDSFEVGAKQSHLETCEILQFSIDKVYHPASNIWVDVNIFKQDESVIKDEISILLKATIDQLNFSNYWRSYDNTEYDKTMKWYI
jgi:hypothetical protein